MTQTRRSPRRDSGAALLSLSLVFSALLVSACSRSDSGRSQGYLEGDFVYVSSPLAGRLDKLSVEKGTRVLKGAPLFELEHAAESAALGQADQQLQAANAQLQDISKGSRPEEIAAMEAHLGQARAAADLAALDLARQTELFKAGAISASDFDRARLDHKGLAQSVDEEKARLETARLGGRSDAIEAAKALVKGAQDAVDHAQWSVDQKSQTAPADALVYDTLYRQGEYVTAGGPVVTLLPPANIKVRFFVSEADYGRIKAGDTVSVSVDGRQDPLEAKVTYLSPQAEYTPPVLYNQDNRSKLVYMIEAVFPDKVAADLHPGQPVDVRLPGQ